MKHHIHHTSLMARSARLDFLPDIMAQFRTRSSVNSDMDNFRTLCLGITLLSGLPDKRPWYASRKRKEMSESEYESLKNRTLFSIKDLTVKCSRRNVLWIFTVQALSRKLSRR